MPRALMPGMQSHGFTLVEVLVALSILLLAALATAQTLNTAALAVYDSRVHTLASAAATQRVEHLLAVPWGDAALSLSPPGTLEENTDGYVDFLDDDLGVRGVGPAPPEDATLVRRWAVARPSTGSESAVVILVVVRSLAADLAGARLTRGEARLGTIRVKVDP